MKDVGVYYLRSALYTRKLGLKRNIPEIVWPSIYVEISLLGIYKFAVHVVNDVNTNELNSFPF
jgi:hypothetical protein